MGRRHKNLLKNEQRQGQESQYEPDIEIQYQVLDVEVPWFGAVQVRPSRRREDIVADNVPGHNRRLLVKEVVDPEIRCLFEKYSVKHILMRD